MRRPFENSPMQFEEYEIANITSELPNVYTLKVKPKNGKSVGTFLPGQFYHIKNPAWHTPHETRPFSVTTIPAIKTYIEFWIKTYGPWSEALVKKKNGESVWLFGPMGRFTLPQSVTHAVFIAGGVGITPIFSMLQSIQENSNISVTLIYANNSPQMILKRKTIEDMFAKKNNWKLISIVSQTNSEELWHGYQGHITVELLKNAINDRDTSTFFVCGSQRFTKQIAELLYACNVNKSHIRQEIFSVSFPSQTT